jgi:hypothetical protein
MRIGLLILYPIQLKGCFRAKHPAFIAYLYTKRLIYYVKNLYQIHGEYPLQDVGKG